MSTKTKIQWTDVTDNIVRVVSGGWWCRKISPGCANCYAERLNRNQFFNGNGLPYTGDPPTLTLDMDIIDKWSRLRHPRRHFVCSMTDVFGEWMSQEMVNTFLDGMAAAPKQIFQVLTKRAENMRVMTQEWMKCRSITSMPENIHLGVSIENNDVAQPRIIQLLGIPCKIRFLSVEPLLEQVDLKLGNHNYHAMVHGPSFAPWIAWVVVGGESGKKARRCDVEWIRDIVYQCKRTGTRVFVKQLGSKPGKSRQTPDGLKWDPSEYRDSKGGSIEEWPADLQIRQLPVPFV